jgi:cyclase
MNKNIIRIIPKLDIKNGLLIKGINLEGLRVIGNPYEFANFYYECGADEIAYVDNVATLYGTNNLQKFIKNTAKNIFIPLSVGGGIRSIKDIEEILKNGADKICINSAAIDNPKFITEASKRFGSANISSIIEVIKIKKSYFISKSNGRDLIKMNPVDWAKKIEEMGSGEIFLTSVNKEGLKSGFDIEIIKKIAENVSIPVIAHGGAGNFMDIYNVIKSTSISGVSISGLFHYAFVRHSKSIIKRSIGNYEFLNSIKKYKKKPENLILKLKKFLNKKKINVRM